jgi:hypothetical protein
MYPKDFRAYGEEGLALDAEANDYDKAMTLLQHVLILSNDNIIALLGMGEIYSILHNGSKDLNTT